MSVCVCLCLMVSVVLLSLTFVANTVVSKLEANNSPNPNPLLPSHLNRFVFLCVSVCVHATGRLPLRFALQWLFDQAWLSKA